MYFNKSVDCVLVMAEILKRNVRSKELNRLGRCSEVVDG